ncbi:lecithin--cholesterol acyltransferase [Methylobacterium sp. 17Sr1-1]|uniref:lipase/acyltransferase domain-containing protein n=1 Tax=Methylobacterium sp. 17Sr1-1 TaxID=2202826 RepID=UPI000D6F9411|nr:lecithin--cholesterol acyltransferase [Methylobacterium sp. 17Sr1-1]AWN52183.1 lecithin--cholesterol acyltransferase [Methylobacterium sp. 17Sr1-1]
MIRKPLRDMVVLLPGITGSVLETNGKDIWAVSGQAAWRALTSLGESLQELRLEGDDPGGIVATRVMQDAHLVPGLVKIDGYSVAARMIADAFDVIKGSVHDERPANYIEFPYDWRLDNRVSARQLEVLVDDRLRRWREFSDNPNARVIFVAHSMGGLVARYYLEVLEGWRKCRALVTFGTPYRGSVSALDFLANGYKRLFVDLTEVMRSFPSVHQLLPIYRALRIGDEYMRVAEAGHVPGVDAALAADALAFHREIEDKVEEHRRDADYRDKGYVILPVVGTRQPTSQSAVLKDRRVAASLEVPSWMDPTLADGDGTVPRASAIPIELSDAYRDSFVPERHGSLQCNRSVLDDLRGRLEQTQVRGLREIRAPVESSVAAERPGLALELDDLYLADEPVTFRARLVNTMQPLGPLQAIIEPVDAPAIAAKQTLDFAEAADSWTLTVEGLPPGLYRLRARTTKGGPFAPQPVHDLFEIAGR